MYWSIECECVIICQYKTSYRWSKTTWVPFWGRKEPLSGSFETFNTEHLTLIRPWVQNKNPRKKPLYRLNGFDFIWKKNNSICFSHPFIPKPGQTTGRLFFRFPPPRALRFCRRPWWRAGPSRKSDRSMAGERGLRLVVCFWLFVFFFLGGGWLEVCLFFWLAFLDVTGTILMALNQSQPKELHWQRYEFVMYGADVTHNYLTPNGFPRGLDKKYFDPFRGPKSGRDGTMDGNGGN